MRETGGTAAVYGFPALPAALPRHARLWLSAATERATAAPASAQRAEASGSPADCPGTAFCRAVVFYSLQTTHREKDGRNPRIIHTTVDARRFLLLFVLMKVPIPAVLLGFTSVAVCCAARFLIRERSFWATLGLWLGAVILSFAVLMVFNPSGEIPIAPVYPDGGQMSVAVTPGNNDTTVPYGDISITIPGGTVQQREQLTVRPGHWPPGADPGANPGMSGLRREAGRTQKIRQTGTD